MRPLALIATMILSTVPLSAEDKIPVERNRSVAASLRIKEYDHGAVIYVKDPLIFHQISHIAAESPLRTIREDRIYQLTVAEQPLMSNGQPETDSRNWTAKILKIEDQGQIIYDASICEIHSTRMHREVVPVAYGLMIQTPEEMKFPHARYEASGGCMSGPYSPLHTYIFICDQCRREYIEATKGKSAIESESIGAKSVSFPAPQPIDMSLTSKE